MASGASTVAHNENIHILRGKGIGGVKTDMQKPEKKDRKERKALGVLSRPAKHLASTVVEASSLKQKPLRHGAKSTKKGQMSNSQHKSYDEETRTEYLQYDEETRAKYFDWEETEIEKVYFTGNDMQKYYRDAMDKCVKEEVGIVLSSMGDWNQILYDYPKPVKKVDDDIEKLAMLDLEPDSLDSLLPSPPIAEFSDFDESFLPEPDIWEGFEPTLELVLKEDSEDDDDTPF